jgi:phosphatidylinositol glycan class F
MTMSKTKKAPEHSKPGDRSYSYSAKDLLPGISYIPTVGVHTTLLAFNALFLPRTTLLQDITRIEIDPAQLSSLDHPQHPFLDALTKSPLSTLVYICFGTAVLQSWWAGYVRDWWAQTVLYGPETERRLDKAMIDRQKVKVRLTHPFYT